ncbi:MAG: pirin family protein [Candidatus Eremiobacteraeota bacterium]|nr:pirin family protein [Candidatus Eremiobacteraeota bacterium]
MTRIVPAQRFVEGGGFVVHRPFPVEALSYVDPFLLIDEMGPVKYAPGEAIGAPDHPHRGFETVTYIIDGEMEHEDSHGHRGAIRSGDVQWMTAGAGVIHSEMPSATMQQNGGLMHGFQIWVNLPKALKMTQPRYQEYTSAQLPIVQDEDRWIRIIAGTVGDVRSPIETTVPTTMLHFKLRPHTTTSFAIEPGSNAIVHTIGGAATVEGKAIGSHQDAVLENTAASVSVTATDQGFDGLLLAGLPLREPVARYGPLVMNSIDEVQAAFADFRAGKFGEIAREN